MGGSAQQPTLLQSAAKTTTTQRPCLPKKLSLSVNRVQILFGRFILKSNKTSTSARLWLPQVTTDAAANAQVRTPNTCPVGQQSLKSIAMKCHHQMVPPARCNYLWRAVHTHTNHVGRI